MLHRRKISWFLVGSISCGAGAALGQVYPIKPIRIVTAEPGGGLDFAGRLIAQGLTSNLGQQVIVDNRGPIAAEIVAKSLPDGYTLLFYGSPIWLAPFLRDRVTYDPVRDFAPITLAVSLPNVLVLHPSIPVSNLKELIALAKAKPGELNYSSGPAGSSNHLAVELFKSMAGVNVVRIPYKGAGPALNALIGGQVQLMFPNAGAVGPHVKSGRLRALAVTSAQPSAIAPELPTMAASGLPGYESVSPLGIFASAKTPTAIIDRLNHEIVRVLATAAVKEKFFNMGIETVGSSPGQFAAVVKADMATWGKVIKDAGIREE